MACDAGNPGHHPVGRDCCHDGDGDESAKSHWESGGGSDKCTYHDDGWVETDDGEDCHLVPCWTLYMNLRQANTVPRRIGLGRLPLRVARSTVR